ncbi:MHYT domain-containing protein, partial [Pseudomonas sp. NBRC 111141]
MEWLGLQLFADLPAFGHIVIDCRHEPFLVLLAYFVACAACFATLDMAERQSHSEDPTAHRQWHMLGACCLAGGIWAMHFISMLAFQAPIEVHYDVSLTILSLLIALAVAWVTMRSLDRSQMRVQHFLQSAVLIGMGIILMHFVGMAAMDTGAQQYYQTGLLLASATIALLTGLAALYLARYFSNGSGTLHQAMKYGASLLMAGGIVATHFTAMSAMTLVIPPDTALRLPSADNSLQLGLGIGFITLLISGASISAALADKKLQSKEHDLRRVNVLLSQLDQARASLQQAAHYDALTNLVNRRGFNQVFEERLAEHHATENRLAVMFLDIDHFKRINDSLGHDAGDELLKVIASHIKAATRHQDLVARLGGDEFCVVTSLSNCDEA